MEFMLSILDFYEFISQKLGENFEKSIRNHLYPNKVLDYLIDNNIEFNRSYIENWLGFEYNNIDYDSSDFFNFMGLHHFDKDDFCLLVTDDGLIEKSVFQFRLMDYDKLVSFYESRYNIDFFQPFDYIIFIFNHNLFLKEIKMLHHEGCIFSAKLS